MKKEEFQMFGAVPKVGSEYIKLKSGQICLWSSFDPKTQMFEYAAFDGTIQRVHRREVEIPTGNEVVEFLHSKRNKPGA